MKLQQIAVASALGIALVAIGVFAASGKFGDLRRFGVPGESPTGGVMVSPQPSPTVSPVPQTQEITSETSSTLVREGDAAPVAEESAVVEYTCTPGQTVFALLEKNGHKLVVKTTSFGKMITTIDGRAQGGQKYWQFSVDGKAAAVGAEAYTCTGSEKIRWELK